MARDSMTHIERRRIAVGDATIYYQATGSGSPVVLVHGLSASTRWWKHNIEPLAERHRVLALDLIGFGASRRRGQRFVLSEAAHRVCEWMDLLGVEQADLIGHSMGGHIAATLTAAFPSRVHRLVLVDAAVFRFEHGLRDAISGLARQLPGLPPRFLVILATDALRAGPRAILGAARQLIVDDLEERLRQIEVPSLVVWGERDPLVPLALGQRAAELIPDARLSVIPAAGHNPMWDRPDDFNRIVLDFIDSDGREPHASQ